MRSVALLALTLSFYPSVSLRQTGEDFGNEDLGFKVTALQRANSTRKYVEPNCKGIDPKNRKCPAGCQCVRLLHWNDVYKFGPSSPSSLGTGVFNGDLKALNPANPKAEGMQLPGGSNTLGGLAYLKTVIQAEKAKARAENFVPIVTFGGDHLGPSFMSMCETAGLHMIEALNELEVDFVSWGNHEIDNGASIGLMNMLCSRFPWLAANMKDTTEGKWTAGDEPLLGSNYIRKAKPWSDHDKNVVPDSVHAGKSFQYQPTDGVMAIELPKEKDGDLPVKICFAGVTTDDTNSDKYGKSVKKKFPKNGKANRFKTSDGWSPTFAPEEGCTAGAKCSVENLYAQCPGFDQVPKVLAADKREGGFTFFEDWKDTMPKVYDAAHKKECSTLVMVTHLNFRDDVEVLELSAEHNAHEGPHDPMVRVVVGGHDHQPHFFMEHAQNAPKHQPERLTAKVGLDGQYLARIDLMFHSTTPSEHGAEHTSASFDHMLFDMRDGTGNDFCKESVGCAPADIIPVSPDVVEANTRVQSLIHSFNSLTEDYRAVELASEFTGTFNTIDVRSKETNGISFYAETLRSWTDAQQKAALDSSNPTGHFVGSPNFARAIEQNNGEPLRVVSLLNSGTFRSNDYAERRYPEDPDWLFSMLEVRSDLPFEDTTSVWLMSAQDLMLSLAVWVSDHGDGMFPTIAGFEFTMEGGRQPKRLRYLPRRETMGSKNTNRDYAEVLISNPVGKKRCLGTRAKVQCHTITDAKECDRHPSGFCEWTDREPTTKEFATCIEQARNSIKFSGCESHMGNLAKCSTDLMHDVGNCPHMSHARMQENLKRDEEVLVIGPEFFMKGLKDVVMKVHQGVREVADKLPSLGIDAEILNMLVEKAHQPAHQMENLLVDPPPLYNAIRDQIFSQYEAQRPIVRGEDCIDPPHEAVQKEYLISTTPYWSALRGYEWALGAANHWLSLYTDDYTPPEICFRMRQASRKEEEPVKKHLEDADQNAVQNQATWQTQDWSYLEHKPIGQDMQKLLEAQVEETKQQMTWYARNHLAFENKERYNTAVGDAMQNNDMHNIPVGEFGAESVDFMDPEKAPHLWAQAQNAWVAATSGYKKDASLIKGVLFEDIMRILSVHQWTSDYYDIQAKEQGYFIGKRETADHGAGTGKRDFDAREFLDIHWVNAWLGPQQTNPQLRTRTEAEAKMDANYDVTMERTRQYAACVKQNVPKAASVVDECFTICCSESSWACYADKPDHASCA